MKKKDTALAGALLLVLAGWSAADAAEIYTLDPIIVTAERTNTKELKTPAAVEIITDKQIRETGAANMQEALKFSTGIITSSQGPRGLSQGTMTAKAVIRGVEKGTLVLVNGVPMNQSGMYNLQDIASDSVEKVEIVRGGGAVLYGSEASGGVINIITKGTRDTKVKAGFGNYGQQNYAVSAQAGDKFGITYSYDHMGKVDHISHPDGGRPAGMYYNIIRAEHNYVDWRYNITDDLYFTHAYSENNSHYVYRYDGRNGKNKGQPGQDVTYKTRENVAGLHYDKNDLKADFYYHKRDMSTGKNKTKVAPSAKTGVSYEKDKWKMSLHANYMADRVLSPSNAHSFDEKPYLLTALTVKYMPNVKSDIVLTVNNILDRDDNINHGSSHYSTVPTNFLLTYNYRL